MRKQDTCKLRDMISLHPQSPGSWAVLSSERFMVQAKVTTRKQRPKGPQAKLSEDPSIKSPVKFLRRVQWAWAMAQWIKSAIKT